MAGFGTIVALVMVTGPMVGLLSVRVRGGLEVFRGISVKMEPEFSGVSVGGA